MIKNTSEKFKFVDSDELSDNHENNIANVKKRNIYINFQTRVLFYACVVILLFVSGVFFLILSFKYNKGDTVKYSEVSSIDYNVCLFDNDIYDKQCLDSSMSYNSKLVKNIFEKYSYNVDFSEQINYTLAYHVIAYSKIYDKNDSKQLLYKKEDVIVDKTSVEQLRNKISFNVGMDIDYKKYNDFVIDYKKNYSSDVNATLEVVVYLDEMYEERIIGTLSIPLGEDSFSIKTKVLSNKDKVVNLPNEEFNERALLYLFIGSLLIVLSLVFDMRLVRLVKATFTKKSKYQLELLKILNNYDRNIVNAKDGYSYDMDKNVVKVESFGELLDASEIVCKPIIFSKINNVKSEFIVEDDDKVYKFLLKDLDE